MADQTVSLLNTDPAFLALQRRQAFAQALAQQAQQPDQVFQGPMGPAAISPLSPISHGIRAFLAAALQGKVDDQAKALQDKNRAEYVQAIQSFMHGQQPGTQAPGPGGPVPPGAPGAGAPPAMPNAAPAGPQVQLPMTPTPRPPQPGDAPMPMGGQNMPTPPAPVAGAAPAGPAQSDDHLASVLAMMGSTNPFLQQIAPTLLNNEMSRSNTLWQNSLPMSTADQQRGAMQLQNEESLSGFNNKLPQTAAQKAETGLGYAQLNKPQFVPYGSTGYMAGGKYVSLPAGAGGIGGGAGDANSPSAPVNLGLSSNAFNLLIGNTAALGTRDKAPANKELDAFFARSGLDPSLVKPQVQAFQNNVNINTMKANAMDSQAKEIIGTIQNYGPVIDKLTSNGNLRLTNNGFELVGSAVNDPNAQQAVFYINQMRADLAGFNAVSGGKIGLHGQVATDNADFAKADEVIQSGLSSGGARALGAAVEATRQKNVAVAHQQVEEAQRGIWNTLGIGPRYDATHPQKPGGAGGPPPPGPKTIVRTGIDKATGKKVIQYSDGSIANAP